MLACCICGVEGASFVVYRDNSSLVCQECSKLNSGKVAEIILNRTRRPISSPVSTLWQRELFLKSMEDKK